MSLAPVAKAIAGAVVGGILAGLAALAVALQTDGITAAEWVAVASATIAAGAASGGVVWRVPNGPAKT
jgi:hypothetical protein